MNLNKIRRLWATQMFLRFLPIDPSFLTFRSRLFDFILAPSFVEKPSSIEWWLFFRYDMLRSEGMLKVISP